MCSLGGDRVRPFGVTLQVEPEWGRVSETSGQREAAFEVETKFIVDTELIQNRLYAAVNFVYVPEISRGLGETLWEREFTLGVTGARYLPLNAAIRVWRRIAILPPAFRRFLVEQA